MSNTGHVKTDNERMLDMFSTVVKALESAAEAVAEARTIIEKHEKVDKSLNMAIGTEVIQHYLEAAEETPDVSPDDFSKGAVSKVCHVLMSDEGRGKLMGAIRRIRKENQGNIFTES